MWLTQGFSDSGSLDPFLDVNGGSGNGALLLGSRRRQWQHDYRDAAGPNLRGWRREEQHVSRCNVPLSAIAPPARRSPESCWRKAGKPPFPRLYF